MQPFISQALLATRTAEMHREAQIAQRARGLKRARRAPVAVVAAGRSRITAKGSFIPAEQAEKNLTVTVMPGCKSA